MNPAANVLGPGLPEVESIDDLLAVAVAIEREAAARYEQLAELTGSRGNAQVATLFRKLAAEERGQEARMTQRADRLRHAPPGPDLFRWKVPKALDEEAVSEAGGPYLLTPYRALCLAVDNEERALRFFVHVTSTVPDQAVRAQAEVMAREALDHLVRLRLERRRAFRAEREESERAGQQPIRPLARSLEELLVCAREMEAQAAERDALLVEALDAAAADKESTALLRQLAAAERRQVAALTARLAGTDSDAAAPVGGEAGAERPEAAAPLTPADALLAALERAEEGYAFYSAVAKESTDETLLRQAQELAEQMVGRLSLISDRLLALASGAPTEE